MKFEFLRLYPVLNWICALSLLGLLCLFFLHDDFFEWAFARHQNVLSWWVRPLMVFPFACAAWFRSWTGIWLSLIAMFSSMFWFPVPATPDPKVIEFLAMEKEFLKSDMTPAHLCGIFMVISYGALLAMSMWRRSLWMAALVIALGGVLKIMWSISFSPEAGVAIVPMAIMGTIVTCLVMVLVFIFWRSRSR
jgi:hypothetical protein